MKSVYKSPQGKNAILERYNRILQYWPQPCEKHTVPTDYRDTFVISSGSTIGSTVVLLHGSMTNSAMWMGDAAILGKNHRVYSIDIIGEPGNSAENRPAGAGHYAKWLLQVFDALGIDKAAVAGNSLGGWMAISFAAYAPSRVNSLVLIASGGLSKTRKTFILKMLACAFSGPAGVEKIRRLVYGDLTLPDEALEFAGIISDNFIPRPPKEYGAHPDKMLGKLSMPVLFIGGEKDVMLPTARNAARLKRLVPHAETVVLKGASHALTGLTDEIIKFTDRNGNTK